MKYSTILALAAATNAHMIMRNPVPFNSPDSSPLDASGSNFPCKASSGSADLTQGTVNEMVVGQPQTLDFTGSATHGGGSCQVSIAQGGGLQVDKNTKWMVIHSIEGGCPSGAAGNLGNDPSSTGANSYQFTIPDHPDIPKGQAVLAWTWHNRIGNREMYMNCAAINISGGGAKKRYAPASYSKRQTSNFPAMFVANIGNGCTTNENFDVSYPNLASGDSVEKGSGFKADETVLTEGACNPGRVGSGSSPTGAASSAPSGAASPTGAGPFPSANTIVPHPSPTGRVRPSSIAQSVGGGFATVSASGAASSPTDQASTPAAAQPTAPVASVPASSASSAAAPVGTGASSPPSAGSSGSCNTGDWNCAADGKSFTRCIAGGTWSASIPMSQGMTCVPGISANFAYNLTGSGAKRDLRSHLMRSRRGNIHAPVLS